MIDAARMTSVRFWPEVVVAERPLPTPKRAVVPGSSHPEADFAY